LIFEHEIPSGSKLYFGKSASLKREIENIASDILIKENFDEILTPNFSFAKHQGIDNERDLIKLNNENNDFIALRADSTLDVVRIIENRLGRSVENKKWFYIQPIFTYPTNESYQIGAEWIGNSNIEDVLNILIKILQKLELNSTLQITNNNIATIIAKELSIDLNIFKTQNIKELLELNCDWLNELIYVQYSKDLEKVVDKVPSSLKEELEKLLKVAKSIDYKELIISPLYYSDRSYYDGVLFRFLKDNRVLATGGNYRDDDLHSSGFALHTDSLIEELI